jgi:hypothetical protein
VNANYDVTVLKDGHTAWMIPSDERTFEISHPDMVIEG